MNSLDQQTLDKPQVCITLEDCIQFVRDNDLCKNWTDLELGHSISLAVKENALAFMTNENGQLNALVWGRFQENERHETCLHIICLAGFSGSLKKFIKYMKTIFPNVNNLTGHRDGELITYNF